MDPLMVNWNPIQLIPAEKHWRAAFVNPDTKEIIERVVVAWALCAPNKSITTSENAVHGIVHLDGRMVPAAMCTHFVGYIEPGVTREQYLTKMKAFTA